MSRRKKDPLRALSADERGEVGRLSRSGREPATVVAHAKAVLAVATGANYTEAAALAGRRSGDAVAHLVARFNREGLEALYPRHAGGPAARYTSVERERILVEAQRTPAARARWDGHLVLLVLDDLATSAAPSPRRVAAGEHLYDLVRADRRRLELAAHADVVCDRQCGAAAQAGPGHGA